MLLSYVDLPVPEPGPADALVEVRACGICGSDVHGIDGTTGRRRPPLVMGHEASGVIARAGAEAGDWREGDRVALDSTIYCGECASCREGRTNLCERRVILGAATDEFRKDGAYAEYVVVPGRVLTRVPEEVSFEHAALVEPLSVALHAVSLAKVESGEAVAVVGTGMIGLLVLQALRAAGAGRVIAIDLDPEKLELARSLGADECVQADGTDVATLVRECNDGRGVDVSIEAVGTTTAIGLALACLRRGGRTVVIGNVTPTVEVPLQRIITGELTIHGSCAFSGEPARALALLAAGTIDVAPLISAIAPLSEGAAWFDRLYRSEPGLMKVILQTQAGAA